MRQPPYYLALLVLVYTELLKSLLTWREQFFRSPEAGKPIAPKAERCYSTSYNKIEDPHITLKVASQTCNEEKGVMEPFFSLQVHCSSSDELSPLRCLYPVYNKCIIWSLVRIIIGVIINGKGERAFCKNKYHFVDQNALG